MTERTCVVCGAQGKLCRFVVEARVLTICREHAATISAKRPETFEDLRKLFVGTVLDVDAMLRHGVMIERRSPVPRRLAEDRRAFPPRPEGRRMGLGRRATDPAD